MPQDGRSPRLDFGGVGQHGGNKTIVHTQIAAGADINAVAGFRYSAIILAKGEGHLGLVRTLLSLGAKE